MEESGSEVALDHGPVLFPSDSDHSAPLLQSPLELNGRNVVASCSSNAGLGPEGACGAGAGECEATPEEEASDSSEEMRNFFTATRPGYKQVAGEVKRVTRLDFEDYHRRRHLESFARSMDQWSEFERKFELKEGQTPQDFTFSRLNFDRYRDTLLKVCAEKPSTLDRFMFDLVDSYYDEMQNEDLNVVMSRLRRKYRIAPSKREIFERLESLQCQTLDQLDPGKLGQPEGRNGLLGDAVGAGDRLAEASADAQGVEAQSHGPKANGFSNGGPVLESGAGEAFHEVKVGSKLKHLLRNKAIRSNSGVVVITVMTSPGAFSCSENCYYCPNEPGQPRSYLSTEPAVLRANQNDFDAVKQFYDRANTLYKNGHVVDKIELIVLGGTWSGYPRSYQEEFVRDLFYAANVYPEQLSLCRARGSLEEEQGRNERSRCRVIGLTLETRPDRISAGEIELLRRFGCTRVQLGIQHTSDEVLELVNRGHTTEQSARAIHLLKENCYKVDIHIMPDLPGSSPEEDLRMFARVLGSEDLQADQWKIYPCEVTPFSEIERWHRQGRYLPYFDVDASLLTNLIVRVKRAVHPWIRLNRVIRDIPNPSIIAGTNLTNMRQMILNRMRRLGLACSCIRCREVKEAGIGEPELVVRQYATRGGTEYFLSYENASRSLIYGFLRLRVSDRSSFDPRVSRFRCLVNAGLVRELHVYGIVVAHGERLDVNEPSQHRGIGASLILAAEIIAAYRGLWKMAIIAGIGTREYYRKHGYSLEDTFMTKRLSSGDIERRLLAAQARRIQVPPRIEVELVRLENAVETLNHPLPQSREALTEPELAAHERYAIDVAEFLESAACDSDASVDHCRLGALEKIRLRARLLARRAARLAATHPLVALSLGFCAASLLLARARRR